MNHVSSKYQGGNFGCTVWRVNILVRFSSVYIPIVIQRRFSITPPIYNGPSCICLGRQTGYLLVVCFVYILIIAKSFL